MATLRRRLADLAAARPAGASAVVPTGWSTLDDLLPGGGLPRDRLTQVVAPDGTGAATLMGTLVTMALQHAIPVAVIDGDRTLDPGDWIARTDGGCVVVRPPEGQDALWAADVLLRSGAVRLLIVDGAPPVARAPAIRLLRLAEDRRVALVLIHRTAAGIDRVPGALRLDLGAGPSTHASSSASPSPPAPPAPLFDRPAAPLVVTAPRAPDRPLSLPRAYSVPRRLPSHSHVPDRRGRPD